MPDICEICGRPAECTHHLIFGSNRKKCDEDKITWRMCNSCHNMGQMRIHGNPMAERMSKIIGQLLWEQKYINTPDEIGEAREHFRKRYGKSYL